MKILVMTIIILMVLLLVGLRIRHSFSERVDFAPGKNRASLYDLHIKTLSGESVDLAKYRGQVALVVNTASKCGLTPQYQGIEALQKEFSNEGFVVLGFPSNDFLNQEPGTAGEIAEFCRSNYGITFPLFEKSKVKGKDKSEVYRLLTTELDEPDWNFTKYLVDRDGHVVARFSPRIRPDHAELRRAIVQALALD